MKVCLLTSRVDAFSANIPGDVIDVPADEAARLIESRQAEAVVETTASDDTEAIRKPARVKK